MTTATTERIDNLEAFYSYVQTNGKLRTADHAKRWTAATLQMLGVNLSGRVKKSLTAELPEDFQGQLKQVFWLAYFRNTNMSSHDFCNRVARRSRGSSDPDFAKYPVQAIFGALKRMIPSNLSDTIKDDLSPELSKMWDAA